MPRQAAFSVGRNSRPGGKVNRRNSGVPGGREKRSMAKEKDEGYEHLYKNVYSNQAPDEYFGQFNTSSR